MHGMSKETKRSALETTAIDDVTIDSRGQKRIRPGVRYHVSINIKEIREQGTGPFNTGEKRSSQRDLIRVEMGEDDLEAAINKTFSILGLYIPQDDDGTDS